MLYNMLILVIEETYERLVSMKLFSISCFLPLCLKNKNTNQSCSKNISGSWFSSVIGSLNELSRHKNSFKTDKQDT